MAPLALPVAPRLATLGVAAGAYAACFFAFHPVLGEDVGILYVVPLVTAGWLFGWRGGVGAGLPSVALHKLLAVAAGDPLRVDLADLFANLAAVGVGGWIGAAADLKARLDAQAGELRAKNAELERSERRFRTLIEHGSDAITLHDEEGRFLYASPALGDVAGHQFGDVNGIPFGDLVHDEERAAVSEAWRACLAQPGAVVSAEFRLRHAGGGWRWVEARGANHLGTPGVRAVVVASRDATERRRMQEEAAERQKDVARRERLAALGTLVSGVAHEVNNPLTVVNGNIELALMDLRHAQSAARNGHDAPPLDDAIRGLEAALGGTATIARVAKALRAVARQGGGPPEPVDVGQVARDVADLLRAAVPPHVRLDVRAEPAPLVVVASASGMRQVVLNLAKNAVDAVAERPAGHVTLAARRAEGGVELVVEDDGPGVAPDAAERLFTPFFTTKPSCAGLGLAIVQGIVRDAGGDVTVGARRGGGASFRVRLPAGAVTPSAGPPPATPASPARPGA